MDEEENITLAQIETNNKLLKINTNEDPLINNTNCKQAIHTILELNEEELVKIEENLRNKILKNGENFLQKYDLVRADNEKIKIEFEQNFAELESSYIDLQSKFETELKNSHLYQAKANENGNSFKIMLRSLDKNNKIIV